MFSPDLFCLLGEVLVLDEVLPRGALEVNLYFRFHVRYLGREGVEMVSRRMVVVFVLLCVGVMNVLVVSTFEQEEYGIAAKNPGQDGNEALRLMVFERLNVERWRNGLSEFVYLGDDAAQGHATTVLLTGDRSLNPALGPGVGENVAYYRIQDQSLPVIVDKIVSDMAGAEADGSRENLLNPGFKYVSVGAAYNDGEICVVVDFYRSFNID